MIERSQLGTVAPRGLTDDEFVAVQALVSLCDRHEGLNLTLHLERAQAHPADPNQFLSYVGELLVGVLSLRPGDPIEVCLAVHPDHRRAGIGRALLEAARSECRRRGRSSWYLICEHQSRSGAAFVRAVGGHHRQSEYRMQLERGSSRAVTVRPNGIVLRRVQSDESEVLARVMASCLGRPAEQVHQRVLQELRAPTHQFFLARDAGEPIGSLGVVLEGPSPYVIAFGVLPEHRRRGYGRQMLEQIVSMLFAERIERILLEVNAGNTPAVLLYRSAGFAEFTSFDYYVMKF